MPHSFGYRARTRSLFKREFRRHGVIPLTTYLRNYKLGDYVDIKGNGAVHKGMPFKYYHGKTGRVWNVTRRAVGVEVNKIVGNRMLKKRIHVRVEHVVPSRCREDFHKRVKEREAIRKDIAERKKKGEKVEVPRFKRLPVQPKPALLVKRKQMGEMETLSPLKYVPVY